MSVTKAKILSKLREIVDPELNYDIVSLGLIREIKIENSKIFIKFLPTNIFCPYLPFLLEAIKEKINEIGFDVEIDVDLEYQWNLEMVDEKIKKEIIKKRLYLI